MTNPRHGLLRLLALLLAFALVAAACGGDDDTDETGTAEEEGEAAEEEGEGEAPAEEEGDGEAPAEEEGEGEAPAEEEGESEAPAEEEDEAAGGEIAPGTTIDVADCPSDWSDTAGITDDEIRLGISLPQSGQLAAFGAVGEGMQIYFDHINETDPIDGKNVVLVARDDAYDPAATQTNVEEMLETENLFAFTSIIGTPNNAQVRPILEEECVPQLFNSTGFPAWGDPTNHPWTIGGLLAYTTEADIWCNHIVDEFGEGATVAGLFMNNDFGASYQQTVEQCAEDGRIDLVESITHEATAADISNEMTTLAGSGAEAFVIGSTAAFCPQAMAAVAQSPWEPLVLLSNTCASIASFFTPIDPAGQGVRLAANNKEVTDAAFADDPAVQDAIAIIEAAGQDPFAGSVSTGVLFATTVEHVLREAAALEGGLTRTNLMRAVWNMDFEHPLLREGITMITSGADDAYVVEGAYIVEYQAPTEEGASGSYETVSDLITVEGETGSFGG